MPHPFEQSLTPGRETSFSATTKSLLSPPFEIFSLSFFFDAPLSLLLESLSLSDRAGHLTLPPLPSLKTESVLLFPTFLPAFFRKRRVSFSSLPMLIRWGHLRSFFSLSCPHHDFRVFLAPLTPPSKLHLGFPSPPPRPCVLVPILPVPLTRNSSVPKRPPPFPAIVLH